MIRKLLLAGAATLALSAPAKAQFVYYPGWFKTLPNGSTLTDTSAGVFSFAGGGNTATLTVGSGGALTLGSAFKATTLLGITGSYQIAAQGTDTALIQSSVGGTGYWQFSSTTVASLKTCNTGAQGSEALATDATVTASGNYGATVVGGGANKVKVYCDATSWKIG